MYQVIFKDGTAIGHRSLQRYGSFSFCPPVFSMELFDIPTNRTMSRSNFSFRSKEQGRLREKRTVRYFFFSCSYSTSRAQMHSFSLFNTYKRSLLQILLPLQITFLTYYKPGTTGRSTSPVRAATSSSPTQVGSSRWRPGCEMPCRWTR